MKSYITMLMLALYLLAVGAPAYASITCQCVAMTSVVATAEHGCCAHCDHDDSLTHGRMHIEAPCCGDKHSVEVDLYIRTSQDSEKFNKRTVVAELFVALAPESQTTGNAMFWASTPIVDREVCYISESPTSCRSLRAPPVLA